MSTNDQANEKTPVAMVSPRERELRKKLKELREHLTRNADYVGPKFPEEARKMHYGEIDHRSIYGRSRGCVPGRGTGDRRRSPWHTR